MTMRARVLRQRQQMRVEDAERGEEELGDGLGRDVYEGRGGGFRPGQATEHRGAHAHDDYPERDDQHWMKHTLSWCDEQGEVRLDYRSVKMRTLTNEVSVFPPKKRVY